MSEGQKVQATSPCRPAREATFGYGERARERLRVRAEHGGAHPDFLVSNEADVYPKNHVERSDLVDGSIGELSPFHDDVRPPPTNELPISD